MNAKLNLTQSGIDRNHRSLELLDRLKIDYGILPTMYYCDEYLESRAVKEIVDRAIIVTILASKGEGLNINMAQNLVSHFGVSKYLFPLELQFLLNSNPEEIENIKFKWQFERVSILFAALGIIKGFNSPFECCQSGVPGKILKIFPSRDKLIENSSQVDKSVVLDQADLYFKLNEVRKTYFKSGKLKEMPFNPAPILERHYAFCWLFSYKGLGWQEIEKEIIN